MKNPWLCASVLVMLCNVAVAGNWQLVHEADDLLVERRNYRGSDLDEIRGRVRLHASFVEEVSGAD